MGVELAGVFEELEHLASELTFIEIIAGQVGSDRRADLEEELFRGALATTRPGCEAESDHPRGCKTILLFNEKEDQEGRMVPRAGIEPARPHGQWILSPQRLPIPPPGPIKRMRS